MSSNIKQFGAAQTSLCNKLGFPAYSHALLFCALLVATMHCAFAAAPRSKTMRSTTTSSIRANHGFVQNKGQIIDQNGIPNRAVLFLAHQPGLNVQLRSNGFSYDSYWDDELSSTQGSSTRSEQSQTSSLSEPDFRFVSPTPATRSYHRVDVELINAAEHPNIRTVLLDASTESYYTTGTPEEGVHGVQRMSRVIYEDIYPHIDLEFFFDSQARIEYQFVVRPGGAVEDIRLRYNGVNAMRVLGGRVELQLARGQLREHIPLSYVAETKQSVQVAYRKQGTSELCFDIPKREIIKSHGRTLVIDPTPTLNWGTYYGGDSIDQAFGICCDKSGNSYTCGHSKSPTNIATTGAFQVSLTNKDSADAFVVKLNPMGQRLWGTYFGGSVYDVGEALCWDGGSNIYLAGRTDGSSGLSTAGAHQSSVGGGFLVKFSTDGSRLWSTYYGPADAWLTSVCVDPSANVFISGRTIVGGPLISTPGSFQPNNGGGGDGFMAKFTSSGVRMWGSFCGGAGEEQLNDIYCDMNGNVLACGFTKSVSGISTTGAHQTSHGGGSGVTDAFLLKVSPDGSTRQWASYYGGLGDDNGCGICCDSSNNVFLYGYTSSQNAMTAGTGQQLVYGGGLYDNFLAKFNSLGQRQWATYSGGTDGDITSGGICLDALQNIIVCGTSGSSNGISSSGSYQPSRAGYDDAFVQKYNQSGRRLWGSYYGGPLDEVATNCAAEGLANILVAGYTKSSSGISTPGSHQPVGDGIFRDAFITRFWDCAVPAPVIESSENSAVCLGTVAQYYVSGNGNDTYLWQNVRLGSIVAANDGVRVLVQWTKLGKDTVRMRETDPLTGCYRDTSFIINVYATPTATSTATVSLCKGEKLKLPATASGGTGTLSYNWSPADSLSSDAELNPQAWPTASTKYTLTVSDARGCTQTASCMVNVYDKPQANAGKDAAICSGASLTLGSLAQKNCRYMWSPASSLDNPALAQPRAHPTQTTSYTVVVTNDSTHCVDSAVVKVRIYAPAAQAQPSQLIFNALGACETSHDTTISITNTGSDSLSFRSQSSVNPAFQVIESFPFSIAPGESRLVRIRFSPSTQGLSSSQITMIAKPCDYNFSFQVQGSKTSVALQTLSSQTDFGVHAVCSSAENFDTTLVLVNAGSSAMTIATPLLTTPFSLLTTGFPQSLASHDTLRLRIRYSASGSGQSSSELQVPFQWTSCSDTLRIALRGASVQPSLRLSQSTLIFAPLVGCDAERDTLLKLYNSTELDQTLDSLSFSLTDFSTSITIPQVIAAHDSLLIPIRYKPTANGTSNATLHLRAEPCAQSYDIQLSASKSGLSFVAPDTVDFGTMLRCHPDTLKRTISLSVQAQTLSVLHISTLDLPSDVRTELHVGDSISSSAARDVQLRYYPTSMPAAGEYFLRIKLGLDPCALTKEIVLRVRIEDQQAMLDSALDYGTLAALATLNKTLRFVNSGSQPLHVQNPPVCPAPFSFLSSNPGIPCDIAPGDSIVLTIGFAAPAQAKSFSDTLVLQTSSPCAIAYNSILRATSSSTIDSVFTRVSLNNIEAPQGSAVSIVMRMSSSRNLQLSGAPQKFSARIGYNRDLLYTGACTTTLAPQCEITVNGTRGAGDTLLILPATLTLGSTDAAPIVLQEFKWTDGSLPSQVELVDGSVRLTGGCDEGGVRLFIPGRAASSLSVRPNPVVSQALIMFGLAEKSTVSLELMNTQGQILKRIIDSESREGGAYTMSDDLSQVANGLYFLRLQTQNYTMVTSLLVMH